MLAVSVKDAISAASSIEENAKKPVLNLTSVTVPGVLIQRSLSHEELRSRTDSLSSFESYASSLIDPTERLSEKIINSPGWRAFCVEYNYNIYEIARIVEKGERDEIQAGRRGSGADSPHTSKFIKSLCAMYIMPRCCKTHVCSLRVMSDVLENGSDAMADLLELGVGNVVSGIVRSLDMHYSNATVLLLSSGLLASVVLCSTDAQEEFRTHVHLVTPILRTLKYSRESPPLEYRGVVLKLGRIISCLTSTGDREKDAVARSTLFQAAARSIRIEKRLGEPFEYLASCNIYLD